MRRIYLRSVPDDRFQPGTSEWEAARADWRDMIEQAVRLPLDRQAGVSIEEMRKGIRVLDALDAAQNNVLELEDADWQHLKEKVEKCPWGMVDRRILMFCDDVIGATEAPRDPTRADGVASV